MPTVTEICMNICSTAFSRCFEVNIDKITVEITDFKETLIASELIWYFWPQELPMDYMQVNLKTKLNN